MFGIESSSVRKTLAEVSLGFLLGLSASVFMYKLEKERFPVLLSDGAAEPRIGAFEQSRSNPLQVLGRGLRSNVNHTVTAIPLKLINSTERNSDVIEVFNTTKRPRARLLCLVLIRPSSSSRIRYVNETWGRRCDVTMYMIGSETTSPNNSNGSDVVAVSRVKDGSIVTLTATEGRRVLWGKTRASFNYAYSSPEGAAIDWFLKADDDTYVVVDNLRQLIDRHDPDKPVWFGESSSPGTWNIASGYMSGGAGYVLSREAVRRLVTGFKCSPSSRGQTSGNSTRTTENRKSAQLRCRLVDPTGDEDVEMGRCMDDCGVKMGVSADRDGFDRFISAPLYLSVDRSQEILGGGLVTESGGRGWSGKCGKNTARCLSDFAISFHPVPAKLMGVFEYFVYQLQRPKRHQVQGRD